MDFPRRFMRQRARLVWPTGLGRATPLSKINVLQQMPERSHSKRIVASGHKIAMSLRCHPRMVVTKVLSTPRETGAGIRFCGVQVSDGEGSIQPNVQFLPSSDSTMRIGPLPMMFSNRRCSEGINFVDGVRVRRIPINGSQISFSERIVDHVLYGPDVKDR